MESAELIYGTPTVIGWYPTIYSWEIEEGGFPGAHYWNGDKWERHRTETIQFLDRMFETQAEALLYAEASNYAW